MANLTKTELLTRAKAMAAGIDAQLLFAVIFGSRLYGTANPGKSDLDVRGVFLPSPQSMLLNEGRHSLAWSNGPEHESNQAGDLDVKLYSLQKWLLELLPEGEIGAIDLLFATTNPDCVLVKSPLLNDIFDQPLAFLNLNNSSGCIKYALGQAKKYGIKGSRLGVLKRIAAWLEKTNHDPGQRLSDIMAQLLANYVDERYCCFQAGKNALRIGGKLYMPGIKISELQARINRELELYQFRHGDSRVDYKALSHALRAIAEMEELLTTGKLVFPLKTRDELLSVKNGEYGWLELEPVILERLARVEQLCASWDMAYNPDVAKQAVLACYNL